MMNGRLDMRKFAAKKMMCGTAMVEFALILPLLLVLVFGIVEFSIALYDKAVITNASREAARAGVIYRATALTNAQIAAVATNASQAHLITLGGSAAPQVTVSKPTGGTAGNPLTVTVTYQYTGLLLGNMLSVMTGSQTLTATTTMMIE